MKNYIKKGMNFPERHDLTSYDEQFDFEGSGFCPQQWEISVRQKRCIIWSVVLSYLKSADFTVPGHFEERLNQLTHGQVDEELAKAAILDFNPFFNIHKCFFDETLKEVCANFRNIFKERRGKAKGKAAQDLQIISSLLKIKILEVNLIDRKLTVIAPEGDSDGNVAYVTLFFKEQATERNDEQIFLRRFHFGLNDDLCRKLRKKALEIILETSEIKTKAEEEILPMLERGEKNINFLITLLKQDLAWQVSCLYESSYIAGKLSNAGFETDPRVPDANGFSAFYHALQSRDKNLVYLLYRYAANSCYESENTFRDPNSCIISNFSKLKEILHEDCSRSNNFESFGDRAEQALLDYQHLQRFNEFLTEISDGINGIRERPEGNLLEEATKRKDIILLILNTYVSEQFFSVGFSERELTANYIKHNVYYDNLDYTVALLFFDNIFLLKSALKSPSLYPRLYSDLESSFLLSAVTNRYFSKNLIKYKMQDLGLESQSINLPIVSLLERLNLRKNITTFCSILIEKTLAEEGTAEKKIKIDEKEIKYMLYNLPELRDEFLISRLGSYLKPLEKVSGGLKQNFVIQRALQVIGESINEDKEDPSSKNVKEKDSLSVTIEEGGPPSLNVEEGGPSSLNVKERGPSSINVEKRNPSSKNVEEEGPSSLNVEEGGPASLRVEKREPASISVKEKDHSCKNVEKVGRSSIKDLLRKCLSGTETTSSTSLPDDTLTVLKRTRNTLSHLKSLQYSLKFEIERDNSLFTSIQSEIRNIEEAFKEVFDIQEVRLMEFLINRGLELVQNIQQPTSHAVFSEDQLISMDNFREKLRKRSSEIECTLEQKKKKHRYLTSVPSIVKFHKKLKGFSISSEEQQIRGEIPPEVKIRVDAIKKLEQDLEGGIAVDLDRFDSLFLKKKALRNMKKEYEKYLEEVTEANKSPKRHSLLDKVRKAPNPLNILDSIFEKKKVSNSQLKVLHEEIPFSDGAKTTLTSLIENHKSHCGGSLANLLNRIKHLQQISIDEQHDIRYLWERVKSPKAKQYLVYKIVQRYFGDSSFRASLELLLFECLEILKNNEEENNEDPFWLKTSYLFNGIDVRNVLAHGDPLLDSIGSILDPKDFPSELVKKMLQLFEDADCIEALCGLRRKAKLSDKVPENCPECRKLKERIVRCGRWQEYSKLLAEDPQDADTCNSILTFLQKVPTSKRKEGRNVKNSESSGN